VAGGRRPVVQYGQFYRSRCLVQVLVEMLVPHQVPPGLGAIIIPSQTPYLSTAWCVQ
jgi:hypothetical protein